MISVVLHCYAGSVLPFGQGSACTIEPLKQKRENFLDSIRNNAGSGLNKMGLYLINVK